MSADPSDQANETQMDVLKAPTKLEIREAIRRYDPARAAGSGGR